MRGLAALALCAFLVVPACADAPGTSLFPNMRPEPEDPAVDTSAKPVKRPSGLAKLFQSLSGSSAKPDVGSGRYNAICGDPSIRGTVVAPVKGRVRGCGIAEPVKVYEIAGVALSSPATVNCRAATALKKWVSEDVGPTIGTRGGGLASLQVAAHYVCRTRNHQPGAKISEHGKGNAIDISAFNLKDGSSLTVLRGWRDRNQSAIMRQLHATACGPFGTVLGPNSDRFHQNHFHLDVARHRSGPYCR